MRGDIQKTKRALRRFLKKGQGVVVVKVAIGYMIYDDKKNLDQPYSCKLLQQNLIGAEIYHDREEVFLVKKGGNGKCSKIEGNIFCIECTCYKEGKFTNLMLV